MFNKPALQKKKKGKKLWFVALTDLSGVNAPTIVSFKLQSDITKQRVEKKGVRLAFTRHCELAPVHHYLQPPPRKEDFLKIWKGILESDW